MMFQNLDTCIIVKVATVISDLEEYSYVVFVANTKCVAFWTRLTILFDKSNICKVFA